MDTESPEQGSLVLLLIFGLIAIIFLICGIMMNCFYRNQEPKFTQHIPPELMPTTEHWSKTTTTTTSISKTQILTPTSPPGLFKSFFPPTKAPPCTMVPLSPFPMSIQKPRSIPSKSRIITTSASSRTSNSITRTRSKIRSKT